ncbi:hypothetical protein EVAR_20211_1 [Eumeta japonica]|uniref:Uncharacterized protein n=1 Tax=Eumeta variegata TaxID=151549 RepID=A0A4C1W9K2_EUMVA|nr:hypothetical protein EVAR_20211_1 [Eumeta japonica]
MYALINQYLIVPESEFGTSRRVSRDRLSRPARCLPRRARGGRLARAAGPSDCVPPYAPPARTALYTRRVKQIVGVATLAVATGRHAILGYVKVFGCYCGYQGRAQIFRQGMQSKKKKLTSFSNILFGSLPTPSVLRPTRLQHGVRPARPVKYRTLKEYGREVTPSVVACYLMSEGSGDLLPQSPHSSPSPQSSIHQPTSPFIRYPISTPEAGNTLISICECLWSMVTICFLVVRTLVAPRSATLKKSCDKYFFTLRAAGYGRVNSRRVKRRENKCHTRAYVTGPLYFAGYDRNAATSLSGGNEVRAELRTDIASAFPNVHMINYTPWDNRIMTIRALTQKKYLDTCQAITGQQSAGGLCLKRCREGLEAYVTGRF